MSGIYSIINLVLFFFIMEKLQCNGCCQGQYIDAKKKYIYVYFLVSGPRVIISGDEE